MFILRKDFDEENPRQHPLIKIRYQDYLEYLKSVSQKLPPSAREFALADWRFDFTNHQCPHDSWVEYLRIYEESDETRKNRVLHFEIKLLGAYHNGFLILNYMKVSNYSLNKSTNWNSHTDWLYDEVRLSDNELVLHEIEFAAGENWIIECEDIKFDWISF